MSKESCAWTKSPRTFKRKMPVSRHDPRPIPIKESAYDCALRCMLSDTAKRKTCRANDDKRWKWARFGMSIVRNTLRTRNTSGRNRIARAIAIDPTVTWKPHNFSILNKTVPTLWEQFWFNNWFLLEGYSKERFCLRRTRLVRFRFYKVYRRVCHLQRFIIVNLGIRWLQKLLTRHCT